MHGMHDCLPAKVPEVKLYFIISYQIFFRVDAYAGSGLTVKFGRDVPIVHKTIDHKTFSGSAVSQEDDFALVDGNADFS